MSFKNYCKQAIPMLVGMGCVLYVIITSLFPSRRSEWFNSLGEEKQLILYCILTVIAVVCAAVIKHVDIDK